VAAPARTERRLDWMEPFDRTIDAAKKYVVSSTWTGRLERGSSARGSGEGRQPLKRESGKGLFIGRRDESVEGGDGMIDEYESWCNQARGPGPTLFAGYRRSVDLSQ